MIEILVVGDKRRGTQTFGQVRMTWVSYCVPSRLLRERLFNHIVRVREPLNEEEHKWISKISAGLIEAPPLNYKPKIPHNPVEGSPTHSIG